MNSVISAIQPKAPREKGWFRNLSAERELRAIDPFMQERAVFAIYCHSGGFNVISSLEKPDQEPGEQDLGPEYHLSITKGAKRCTTADALWILGQFDLLDAKEDNHVPFGQARNYWRPVADRFSGYECPCQDSEPTIREDKGDYIWRPAPAR